MKFFVAGSAESDAGKPRHAVPTSMKEDAGCQTLVDMEAFTDLELEVIPLRNANEVLKSKVENLEGDMPMSPTQLNEKTLRGKDKLVLYYTGLLTFELLLLVF